MFYFCRSLDPYNRRMIWTMIRKMRDAGKCIILTTHFLEEADILSDRIAIMARGRLQASGTPDYLKSRIGLLIVGVFGLCNFALRHGRVSVSSSHRQTREQFE